MPSFYFLRVALPMLLVATTLAEPPRKILSDSPQSASTSGVADLKIAAALKDVSAERIQATIQRLVGFGTRLTLSAQDPASIQAGHGIGAAREWIKSEFERYSQQCGGCLEVKTDSFIEQPADRIPKPTVITNVYAVLKGTDPESAKRIVLVTGHYDSRNSDTFDVNGMRPAPMTTALELP
jgi:hypothetical protein